MTQTQAPKQVSSETIRKATSIIDGEEGYDEALQARLHMLESYLQSQEASLEDVLEGYIISKSGPLGVFVGDERERIEEICSTKAGLSIEELEQEAGTVTTYDELVAVAAYHSGRDDLLANEKEHRVKYLYGATAAYLDVDVDAAEFRDDVIEKQGDAFDDVDAIPARVRAAEFSGDLQSHTEVPSQVQDVLALDPNLNLDHLTTGEGTESPAESVSRPDDNGATEELASENSNDGPASSRVESGPAVAPNSESDSEQAGSDTADAERLEEGVAEAEEEDEDEPAVHTESQSSSMDTAVEGDSSHDPTERSPEQVESPDSEPREGGRSPAEISTIEAAEIDELEDIDSGVSEVVDRDIIEFWGCPYCEYTNESSSSVRWHITSGGGAHKGYTGTGLKHPLPGYDGAGELVAGISVGATQGADPSPAGELPAGDWETHEQREAAESDVPIPTMHNADHIESVVEGEFVSGGSEDEDSGGQTQDADGEGGNESRSFIDEDTPDRSAGSSSADQSSQSSTDEADTTSDEVATPTDQQSIDSGGGDSSSSSEMGSMWEDLPDADESPTPSEEYSVEFVDGDPELTVPDLYGNVKELAIEIDRLDGASELEKRMLLKELVTETDAAISAEEIKQTINESRRKAGEETTDVFDSVDREEQPATESGGSTSSGSQSQLADKISIDESDGIIQTPVGSIGSRGETGDIAIQIFESDQWTHEESYRLVYQIVEAANELALDITLEEIMGLIDRQTEITPANHRPGDLEQSVDPGDLEAQWDSLSDREIAHEVIEETAEVLVQEDLSRDGKLEQILSILSAAESHGVELSREAVVQQANELIE